MCSSLKFLLLFLLLLSCNRTAQRQEIAVSGYSENRRTLEVRSGETVLQAALRADSVIVYQTDTLTVAKYYAVSKTETLRDTLTVIRSDTVSARDTVYRAVAEKTEAKGGMAAIPWQAWAAAFAAIVAAILWRLKK
jgi:hypothetical protein